MKKKKDNYKLQDKSLSLSKDLWINSKLKAVPLYRLFNSDLADNFYTVDEDEKTEFIAAGYTFEGI